MKLILLLTAALAVGAHAGERPDYVMDESTTSWNFTYRVDCRDVEYVMYSDRIEYGEHYFTVFYPRLANGKLMAAWVSLPKQNCHVYSF